MWELNRREFAKVAINSAGALAFGPLAASAAQQPPAGSGAPAQRGATPLAPVDKQPPDVAIPQPKRKAGYAVVGLGQLAIEEVLPAFGEARMSHPVAFVSGHPDKARQLAEVYGVKPTSIYDYNRFNTLRDNNDVDVVYIILPNSLHAEFTIRALEAGKHVLCEKPMASTPAECEKMIAAAKAADRKLMIAYRLHYEPFNRKVMELCEQKTLGRVKTFFASNCQTTKAPNIRLSTALSGGPVRDTGIYCINAARYVTGEEPIAVTAIAHQPKDDPTFREVPESVAFTLHYPSGVVAHCDTSFGTVESRCYRVNCAEGFINLDQAFSYRGQRLRVKRGSSGEGEVRDEELLLREVNHFAAEMDHFSDCVMNGKDVLTPGALGLADLRIIEAVEEAIRTGGAVKMKG